MSTTRTARRTAARSTSATALDALAVFRRRAAHTLLTREEEVALGERIARGRKAAETLAGSAISPTLRRALVRDVRDGERAREELVLHNLRLVDGIARRFEGHGLDRDDLIQEGIFGLTKAVDRFDPTLGNRFATCAFPWIRQAMNRAIGSQCRTIRVPENVHEEILVVTNTTRILVVELGREPTVAELVEATGFSAERIADLRRWSAKPGSIDAPIAGTEDGGGDPLTLGDTVAADADEIGDLVDEETNRAVVERVLSLLDDLQRKVLVLRSGLDGTDPLPLAEVAERLERTPGEIRQIESAAFAVLRHPASGLRDLLADTGDTDATDDTE